MDSPKLDQLAIQDIVQVLQNFYGNEWCYRAIHKNGDGTLIHVDNGKEARRLLRTHFNIDMRDKWGDE